jgi:hypothetical protein
MEKQEFAMLAAAMRTYYSKENLLPNQQAMELWYRELKDIPFPVAEAALRKWVATNKWSPSIAEIREMTVNVTQGDEPTWGEAWEKALHAVRRYGMYRPKEALDSLDPLTRRCVEKVGFREMCMSENIAVERANFRMIYETLAERRKTEQQLALPLREAISRLQIGGGMLQIGERNGNG